MHLFHRWKYSHGNFHIYYECTKCPRRKIVLGAGGYQPLDYSWLGLVDKSFQPCSSFTRVIYGCNEKKKYG